MRAGTTVWAVMARTAWEKKKQGEWRSALFLSSPQPDQPTFWDYGPPLTMFSENPHHPPIGSHPYQRSSPSPSGKNTGKGKGTSATMTYADIANKGKQGQKGQKGQKGPKGQKGDKGGKGPKGDPPAPELQGGKAAPKGGKK